MKQKLLCCGILAILLFIPAVFCISGDEGDQKPAPCCFDNPSLQGYCKVIPTKDETCESILEYLNTPNSGGKNYCNSTRIRGDWSIIDCPK